MSGWCQATAHGHWGLPGHLSGPLSGDPVTDRASWQLHPRDELRDGCLFPRKFSLGKKDTISVDSEEAFFKKSLIYVS